MPRPTPRRLRGLGALAALAAAGLAVTFVPTASAAPTASTIAPASVSVSAGVATARPGAAERRQRAEAAHDALDQRSRRVPREVAGWYVDDATGQTVVSVVGGDTPAANDFVAGLDPTAVRVETNAVPPRPLADLVDGTPMYGSGMRCSLGFSVRKGKTVGVLTAGHCTNSVKSWNGSDRTTLGTTTTTKFPTDDYGLITVTNAKWTPTAKVQGGPSVTGSKVAAIGATVCRSGSTTNYQCGKVVSRDQSVNYGNGNIVKGLTRTTACAEPGDSGGAFIEPGTRQAQGLTSGGTGDCTKGGVTFFQPVNEALTSLGLTLVTAS